jgi:hypothetical protein
MMLSPLADRKNICEIIGIINLPIYLKTDKNKGQLLFLTQTDIYRIVK